MSAVDDDPQDLERLSALVDGDADARVAAAISAAWRGDRTVRARWHSYQLIGDVMRSDELAGRGRDAEFLAALRLRLADEPAVIAPAALGKEEASDRRSVGNGARVQVRRWAPPAALAAGFVVVAIGAMTVWRPATEERAAVLATGAPEPAVHLSSESPTFATLASPMTLPSRVDGTTARLSGALIRDQRLDAYLAAHQQFGGSSALGVSSGFLRNATHESVAPASR